MTLIGDVIKTALSLKDQIQIERKNAVRSQEKELRSLLSKAKDTAFGKYYCFQNLLDSKDLIDVYRETVPIHEYDDIHTRWWEQQVKYPDITWPGIPDYFAITSGTTGSEGKRIPVTRDFIQSMRKVGLDQLSTVAAMDIADKIFSCEALVISSSATLVEKDGHMEGDISGINVSRFPDWYKLFYRPGKKIAEIKNWDERTERIAEEAPKWNIGAIAGIPSWVQLCLKKIINRHDLEYIDDLWPNASLFISGGVAFETYEQSFRQLFRKPITVLDTFLASEGFFAYGVPSETLEMQLALSHGYYYEFIPFNEQGFNADGALKKDPEIIGISSVQEGAEYALLVSTCSGAWRYMLGDTIKFTNIEKHYIKITGRTKHWLNVVGSQLTEEKLDTGILRLSEQLGIEINEYSVGCIKEDGQYYHQWILVTDDSIDDVNAANTLDETLRELNKGYNDARHMALSGVRVLTVTKDQYQAWLRSEKQLGGQIKVQKVMREENLRAYMEFLNKDD